MSNNIVKWEKLYSFLMLYRRSYEEDFTEEKELLELSKEIARIGDEEYRIAPKIIKRTIDVVRMFEFDALLKNKHHRNDEAEEFLTYRAAKKVSEIKNPTNEKQRELIAMAKEYLKEKNNN